MHLSVPTIIGAASVVQAFPHFAYPNTRFALPPSKGLMGLKTGNESWGTLKPNHFTWSPPGPNDRESRDMFHDFEATVDQMGHRTSTVPGHEHPFQPWVCAP